MAHTNETPNYHLPQYIGTDIINPLVDTNGAYSDIDTALKDIADAEVADAGAIDALEATVGDNTAGLVKDVADLQAQNGNDALTTVAQTLSAAINEVDAHADTNAGNIADNSSAITSLQNTVGNANSGLVKDVADNASAITGLQNTVGDSASGLVKDVGDLQTQAGNDALTTVAQTLSGAINELDNGVDDVAQSVANIKTIFNATDVMPVTLVEVSADGVKTLAELLAELHTAVNTYLSALEDGQKVLMGGLANPNVYAETVEILSNTHGLGTRNWSYFGPKGTGLALRQVRIASSGCHEYDVEIASDGTVTFTDHSSDVPTSGTKIQFQGIRNF